MPRDRNFPNIGLPLKNQQNKARKQHTIQQHGTFVQIKISSQKKSPWQSATEE